MHSSLLMSVQCPDCLSNRTAPDAYRWYEVPLGLLLLKPYRCRHCGRRFLRLRRPDMPIPLRSRRSLVAR